MVGLVVVLFVVAGVGGLVVGFGVVMTGGGYVKGFSGGG